MKKTVKAIVPGLLAAAGLALASAPAAACSNESYLGTVCAFGFNFCPRGTLPADGRQLPVSQYSALFSLLGVQFGGDGRTSFALPDLRGRAIAGAGAGPGLSPVQMGEKGGSEQVTLSASQLAAHTHTAATSVTVNATARAQSAAGNSDSPTGNSLAVLSRQAVYSSTPPNVDMNAGTISTTASASTTVNPAGAGQPVPIRSPYQGLNYCIVVEGIYPQRN